MAISVDAPKKIIVQFDKALENLREAKSFGIEQYKPRLMSAVHRLLESPKGLQFLHSRIEELHDVHIFQGSAWEDPHSLVPTLVGGTLKAGGEAADFEILSELRLLAIANGRIEDEDITAAEAGGFLQKVLANNLEFLFPESTEEARKTSEEQWRKIRQLFELLVEEIPLEGIKENLLEEVEMICAQRPIVTDRAQRILQFVKEELNLNSELTTDHSLREYVDCLYSPTFYLHDNPELSPEAYGEYLDQADDEQLKSECLQMGQSMSSTGLTSPWSSVLLNKIVEQPIRIHQALALNQSGKAELMKHKAFVKELITRVINPATHRCIYGLGRLLERNLLSHQPVETGLKRLLDLKMDPSVSEKILQSTLALKSDNPAPEALLTADTLSVLGQPLGVGQGWNPTCQSARGISLWSSHAPGKLLNMIISAATENNLSMRFEGTELNSSELLEGLAKELDYHLDMVSIVLVPHLDRLYNEMMRRCALRPEDGHKWVNPAMYGHWIPNGFLSAYNVTTDAITNYEEFIRTFYATHHPSYNGGHDLAYPNPVGIFITSSSGKLLGFHAVSILRVAEHAGEVRVYFLNPNNEGRQTWGPGLEPTVVGKGERYGESSLPFYQFASRIYAFHYLKADLVDPQIVPDNEVNRIIDMARSSWGHSYTWSGQLG
ncbi:hypothetical protein SAMN05443144_102178 [Fodinibius roseus]|uniref:Uncharacterized protein n=1 Tax=Fodinibius roseus TaxID=1194090 RepID=A0A1M4V244_9BACT|nr:hypothetical protein [Fodinibius roseus]SHE62958.1 hypothetical protein SAMN05443144_102178 [Fodinibius roseus]